MVVQGEGEGGMLRVTVDIFSGRPNPSWIIDESAAREIVRDLALNSSAVGVDAPAVAGLGYRATVIEFLDERVNVELGLPARVAIANRTSTNESKGIELASKLIAAAGGSTRRRTRSRVLSEPTVAAPTGHNFVDSHDQEFRQFLLAEVEGRGGERLRFATRAEGSSLSLGAAAVAPCAHEVLPFTPAFWNDPAHIRLNNCYAYASNRRTDTFPQPGRASGAPIRTLDCPDSLRASVSDGAHLANNCFPDTEKPRLLVALVIWPGRDYHWYRLHSEGFWGHKPGQTAARNTDDSGLVIQNPQTCNRGPYTSFCDYLLLPQSIRVA